VQTGHAMYIQRHLGNFGVFIRHRWKTPLAKGSQGTPWPFHYNME